jgi:hypothetical protein
MSRIDTAWYPRSIRSRAARPSSRHRVPADLGVFGAGGGTKGRKGAEERGAEDVTALLVWVLVVGVPVGRRMQVVNHFLDDWNIVHWSKK